MRVIEFTVQPEYMYVHVASATNPVPEKFLDESKCYKIAYMVHEIQEDCDVYLVKNFWDSWGTQINFPMLSEEYLLEYGVDQPTVFVMIFDDGYDSLLNAWLELGNGFLTHRELPESDAAKYFI